MNRTGLICLGVLSAIIAPWFLLLLLPPSLWTIIPAGIEVVLLCIGALFSPIIGIFVRKWERPDLDSRTGFRHREWQKCWRLIKPDQKCGAKL
jgi:hypothetical protein